MSSRQDAHRPHAATVEQMTNREFRELYERLRRRNPWGPEDRRGALNHLTPQVVLDAVQLPTVGRTISLAAPIEDWPTADNPNPAQHVMTTESDAALHHGLSFSMDRIAMNIHGNADSHIDALCHVVFDGKLYNGVSASTVTEEGASELSIAIAENGIVGRGVLLDIPKSRGVRWLEPGDHVTEADLLGAEDTQGVRISRGDIAFVRVGHRRRRKERGPWDAAAARAGLHPSVLPLLAEREIAALGSDGNNDTAPSAVSGVDFPVHVLAVNALGLHLFDYLNFTSLAPACAAIGRWTFLCIVAPLRLPTGTGSPVNPIAIL